MSYKETLKEIDEKIAKLQKEKEYVKLCKNNYEQFHLNRIEDILFRGTSKTPQNSWSSNKLSLTTTEEKLYFIISSLFEMQIIEDSEVEHTIQQKIRQFFTKP